MGHGGLRPITRALREGARPTHQASNRGAQTELTRRTCSMYCAGLLVVFLHVLCSFFFAGWHMCSAWLHLAGDGWIRVANWANQKNSCSTRPVLGPGYIRMGCRQI
jgi:hypothetical protein